LVARKRRPAALVSGIAAGVFACSGGAVTDGTAPVVQRGTLTVQVTIDPADAATASTIGVTPAGLTVRLVRNLSADGPRTAITGGDGIARSRRSSRLDSRSPTATST